MRTLCISAFPVIAYDETQYRQFAFYLNATPPKLYTPFGADAGIRSHFDVPKNRPMPFNWQDFSSFRVLFSETEQAQLKAGNTLKIAFLKEHQPYGTSFQQI